MEHSAAGCSHWGRTTDFEGHRSGGEDIMMRIQQVSVVTCILLAMSMQPLIVTSVVNSYEKLQRLADKGDSALIKGIEDAINERQEKIKNLTTILAQYHNNLKGDYQFQADHPNDFYLLVKHHVSVWFGGDIGEDLLPVMEEVIRKQNLSFPIMDDFGDAALALVRLQYVYKLKAQDMFEGNYLGYMGSALTREDAYLIGKQAFQSGYLPQAQVWLQMNVDLLTDVLQNGKQEGLSEDEGPSIEDLREEYFWTLCLLGRTYFYMNDSKTAQKLYEQCNHPELTDNEEAEELGKEIGAHNSTELLEQFGSGINAFDENTSALCSREKNHRVTVTRPHHVCRYKRDPFIPYRCFREEILSTSPYASVFYDVIHDSEIERLKEITRKGLTRGTVGRGRVSDGRTGDLHWVHDDADPLVARVSQRVKAFSGLDVTIRKPQRRSAEKMQVVNYGLGGHYGVHMDPVQKLDNIQNRLATVLFYLTDVEKGGATIFPKVGVSVSPVKGMGLMWYNYEPHMKDRDVLTHHAGCPVLMGNKWIANKWIWIYGNMFRRPCGPSPHSEQLDVENIVSVQALKQVIH